MIKNIKTAVLFLAYIIVSQVLYGQNPVNITELLSEKFNSYIKAVPRQEIYIHADREEFISGEDFWFNVYTYDRQSYKPSGDSKIAYVELLNKENRPIVQRKIFLDGGFGPGHMNLPDTLSTGIYTVRAYTSWMKNFLPYNCFVQDIKIYNAFSNKVIKEKLVSGKRIIDGTSTRFYKDGLSFTIEKTGQDGFDLVVMADEKYRSGNGNIFYMFIETHGNIDRVSSERITGERTRIPILGNQLRSGINHITLFNSVGKPVCERFIYTPVRDVLVPVISSADSLLIREKLSIDVDFGQMKEKIANFSISVSPLTNNHSMMDFGDYMVFGTEFGFLPGSIIKGQKINSLEPVIIDSLLKNVRSNWVNWNAILANDLPLFMYPVENENSFLAGKLFAGIQKAPARDKYVLLSFPGKNAVFQYSVTDEDGYFSFPVHIGEKVNDIVIQPEIITGDHMISIESQFSDLYSKPGIQVDSVEIPHPSYISLWGVNNQVRKIYGVSSAGGLLHREIPGLKQERFYGKPDNELILKEYIALPVMEEVFFELLPGVPMKKKKLGYEISMNNPLNNQPYESDPGLFVDGVFIQDASIIANLDPENVEKIDVVRDKYYVGDYRFYGLINVITKTGDFSSTPLPSYAVRLQYRAIDPVPSFVSPDYSNVALKKNRIPDFRNTLYWNPDVKMDGDGMTRIEFWTSDFVTGYEINIQGISSEGKAFSGRKFINVKRQ